MSSKTSSVPQEIPASDWSQLRFHYDPWGQLVLTLPNGEQKVGVEPIRCFPLSSAETEIGLVDDEGRELANFPNLSVLNPEAREAIQRDLASRDFVPVIQRIVKASATSPPSEWTVETDRGRTVFQLDSEDDVRKIGAFGLLIADANGIRYRIPDTRTLDAYSQGLAIRFL